MMTLALRLGKTLHELQRDMSASELLCWMAYDRRSPLSDRRGDIQAAQIASAVYQSQGGKVKLEDALLQWGADPPQDDQALSGLEGFLSNLS
ncbi:Gp14 [Xenorhabdus bovienii str. feltiae Florida]|nr:Gp14 [Xenorhabdus bovienii str. feltiae Florida]